jgi:hypothetical protein
MVFLVVFKVFFDIVVGRGVKQHPLSRAGPVGGGGPPTTIDEVMTRTIHDAVRVASLWALFVFVAGLGVTAVAVRAERGPS